MKNSLTKKGQVDGYLGFVVSLGVGVILLGVIAIMLQAFHDSQTANSYARNIAADGLTFVDNTTGQFGTAGTVLGVSLLLIIIGAVGIWGYRKFTA